MVFHDEADRSNIEAIIKAFDDFCIGETNIMFERYTLNKRAQEQNKSFATFLTELRRLVKSCDYSELEDSILNDRIVIGVRKDSTRRKLLQIRKLDLAAVIDVCRASETSMRHLRDMRGAEDVHRVGATASASAAHHRSKSRDRLHDEQCRGDNDGPPKKNCQFCGNGHKFKKELCPTYLKRCRKCSLLNHFKSMCPNKMTNSKGSSRHECKQVSAEQDSDSDTESIFVVH